MHRTSLQGLADSRAARRDECLRARRGVATMPQAATGAPPGRPVKPARSISGSACAPHGVVLLWLYLPMGRPVHAGLPETPQPQQLTVADGLPSNRINDIAEDASGYLWIATSDGLARYDGIGFRIWRVGQGLRDNNVWAVHVDARNRVWVGTGNAGLAMLDATRRLPLLRPQDQSGDRQRRRLVDRDDAATGRCGSARPTVACTGCGATAHRALHAARRRSAQSSRRRRRPARGRARRHVVGRHQGRGRALDRA